MTKLDVLPDRAGVGLKGEHYADIVGTWPDLGFFEVHAENYMGDGGPPHRYLETIAAHYPLSFHGVGLSIGGDGPIDQDHIGRLKTLIDRYRPASFSEHLAWSTHDSAYLNDLLPLPYTEQTLARVCEHVDEVQNALGRRMLLENPSTYVLFSESTIEETEFLTRIADRTGCGLLLDVNNVMVSTVNHRLDPYAYIERFALDLVGEIHMAGYDETVDGAGDRLLIDAHGSAVRPDVFELFVFALNKAGPRPVLVEWDNNVPGFAELHAEARRVEAVIARSRGSRPVAAQ
ncbi:DUF692 domain-containing protein [Pelagibacterium montanilacus]|uniref:MNIO family bufferin maturase n=1 Tax=Pelagibacterium montanilacus TaxID=2185280 RepID=UPI000F8D7F97|nr:DUF692 domain-containing protein [Pelagibacterium montanilacus]